MVKRLILTPNKKENCGMYQLAKDLKGDIFCKEDIKKVVWEKYSEIITMLYPMHIYGKIAQKNGLRWICYDQGIPPINKMMFPNFFRRQYMRIFKILNESSMAGADEYWDISRSQKPRWTKRMENPITKYAIYLGRRTDYKNFDWLETTMNKLGITFIASYDWNDKCTHHYLSMATMLVTASLWEGYGRPVMEAEALGIPAVAYDTGSHKKHIKKGICVPLGNEEDFEKAIIKIWNRK